MTKSLTIQNKRRIMMKAHIHELIFDRFFFYWRRSTQHCFFIVPTSLTVRLAIRLNSVGSYTVGNSWISPNYEMTSPSNITPKDARSTTFFISFSTLGSLVIQFFSDQKCWGYWIWRKDRFGFIADGWRMIWKGFPCYFRLYTLVNYLRTFTSEPQLSW